MSSLATLASKVYNDRDAAVISPEDSLTMKKLIYLGTSAGGMRPKAVVAITSKRKSSVPVRRICLKILSSIS